MHNHNNDEEQQQQRNVVVDKAKDQAKRFALKKGAKALKKGAVVALKLAAKFFAVAMKAVLGFLASIGLPYILIILAVLFAIFIIFISSSMIFSNADLKGEAGELQKYIERVADSTVDMSRASQVPYKVHEELIIAIMQLYESENRGMSTKDAIKLIAEELKPIFEYTDVEGHVEYEIWTCVKTEKGEVCTVEYDTKYFTQTFLTHVTAWNGYMTAELKEAIGPWVETVKYVGENTRIITKSRAHSWYTVDEFVEDYTHYENVLMGDPFNYGDTDLALIEVLYMSTGRMMNYTDQKKALSLGNLSAYLDVVPGTNVPAEFMPYYLAAQQKYGVDWSYLAAIHFIETGFSTHPTMISSVGAEGHFQFMRCTWHGWSFPGCKGSKGHVEMTKHELYNPKTVAKYGGYGIDADGNGEASPWDIHDAVFTAAYYLQKNGFKENPRRAIWHYNHSESYVNRVMKKAEEFREAAYIGSREVANSAGFIRPAKGRVSSQYGWRTIKGQRNFHKGVDIANTEKTPLYAAANGTVTVVGTGCNTRGYYGNKCNGGRGNYVQILFDTEAGQYEGVYMHLYSVQVKKGQVVEQGEIIGLMGTSGSSTGSHLHFELYEGKWANRKDLNPTLYIPL